MPKVKSAAKPLSFYIRHALTAAVALGLVFASAPAMSQTSGGGWSLINGMLQKRAEGILSMMQYTLFPDVTTSIGPPALGRKEGEDAEIKAFL